MVYFGSDDDHLYAVDTETGEEKWRNNLAGGAWVTSSPVIVNETVYAGTLDGYRLHAVHIDTGEELWAFVTGGWVWSLPAFAEEIVYVGSGDGHLYAMNAQTGQEVWNYETGDSIYSSPLVADGGGLCWEHGWSSLCTALTAVDRKVYFCNDEWGRLKACPVLYSSTKKS